LIMSESGFSWGQLARLLDVPERRVRLWASGANMHSDSYRAAKELLFNLNVLGEQTPEDRQKTIFMPGESGKSLFDQWREDFQDKSYLINPSSWSSMEENW
jgi:hypothetical protein